MPAQIKPLLPKKSAALYRDCPVLSGGYPGEGVHILTEAAHGPDRDLLDNRRLMDRQALPLSAAMGFGRLSGLCGGHGGAGEQPARWTRCCPPRGILRQRESLDNNLRSALTYPLIMVGMMVVVVAIIGPGAAHLAGFCPTGRRDGPFSRMAMEMGAFMSRHSLLFMGLLGLLWIYRSAALAVATILWLLRCAGCCWGPAHRSPCGCRALCLGHESDAPSGLAPEQTLDALSD